MLKRLPKKSHRIEFEIDTVHDIVLSTKVFAPTKSMVELATDTRPVATVLFEIAREYPATYLCWYETQFLHALSAREKWPDLLRHDLEVRYFPGLKGNMTSLASLAIANSINPFLMQTDDCPIYPSWLISPIAGVCRSEVLSAFNMGANPGTFAVTLVEIGQRGTTYGLCPYADSRLFRQFKCLENSADIVDPTLSEVAAIVGRINGRRWLLVWLFGVLFCLRRLPIIGVLRALRRTEKPKINILSLMACKPDLVLTTNKEVEVVIPTLDRPEHLLNVLKDLSNQDQLPKRVHVIEQKPGENQSDVFNDQTKNWPFDISYYPVDWVGVCRARNLGIRNTSADWVFLLDDDVRLPNNYISHLLAVAFGFRVDVVNASLVDPNKHSKRAHGQVTWPWFSAGIALCSKSVLTTTRGFDEKMEYEYAEEYEFGVRIRRQGTHVIYTTGAPVEHLSVDTGGFRSPRWPGASRSKTVTRQPLFAVLFVLSKFPSEPMLFGYRVMYTLQQLSTKAFWHWPLELIRSTSDWRKVLKRVQNCAE